MGFENLYFDQLKPRLQKLVLDSIFKNYYNAFKYIFEDIGHDFQRVLFMNVKFEYYGQLLKPHAMHNHDGPHKREEDEPTQLPFIKDIEIPNLEQIGGQCKYIYFIISGKVYLMDPTCMYVYGIVSDGGYFGDISALLNRENEFNYMYDPFSTKPVLLLKIERNKFIEICDNFPAVKTILLERAYKRLEIFRNFKLLTMIRYMRFIARNPHHIEKDTDQAKDKIKHQMIKLLVAEYDLNRMMHKFEFF